MVEKELIQSLYKYVVEEIGVHDKAFFVSYFTDSEPFSDMVNSYGVDNVKTAFESLLFIGAISEEGERTKSALGLPRKIALSEKSLFECFAEYIGQKEYKKIVSEVKKLTEKKIDENGGIVYVSNIYDLLEERIPKVIIRLLFERELNLESGDTANNLYRKKTNLVKSVWNTLTDMRS